MQQQRPDVKHIKVSDFPRTPWAVSFGVRKALLSAFNYCRQYPEKMGSFKATLEFVMVRIAEWEQQANQLDMSSVGSQRAPLVSKTDERVAQTVNQNNLIVTGERAVRSHSDEIEAQVGDPVASTHTPVNGAAVAPVIARPPMPSPGGLKVESGTDPRVQEYIGDESEGGIMTSTHVDEPTITPVQPVQQPVQQPVLQQPVEQVAEPVQQATLPPLAQVLAQNAQA